MWRSSERFAAIAALQDRIPDKYAWQPNELGYYLNSRPDFAFQRCRLGGFLDVGPIFLSESDFNQLWPWVGNVWEDLSDTSPSVSPDNGDPYEVAYFRCRFARLWVSTPEQDRTVYDTRVRSCGASATVVRIREVVNGQVTGQINQVKPVPFLFCPLKKTTSTPLLYPIVRLIFIICFRYSFTFKGRL